MASELFLKFRDEIVESSHYFKENPLVLAAATIVCAYFCVHVFRLISVQQAHQEALQIMVSKRFERDEVVHRALEIKAKNTKRFVDVTELIAEFKSGARTCKDALLQLAHASHELGLQPLCATTEEFYDEALATAEGIDGQRDKQGRLPVGTGGLGPLAGVPISIKDNFHMRGADSTIGIACRCFKPKEKDGTLVAQLRTAGAVPFVKSNIPPLLLMPESDNKLWGTCRNPWDLGRTPGGSSGGEAALVAAGCSLWGLGGDIGGSIRIPATYCGVVGFKPSFHRVSKQGSAVNRVGDRTGQQIILSSAGPLARSVRDCALMMEVLTHDVARHDFSVPALPWNTDMVQHGPMVAGVAAGAAAESDGSSSPAPPKRRSRKAQEADLASLRDVMANPPALVMVPKRQRVALMLSDGWCDPVPAVTRAVQEAAGALRAAGYEVVPFKNPIDTTRLLQVYLTLMSADGNWHFLTK
jgi:Asp-tRNA(Asn)/Glu-tRNA(Gln) amidotransferase A subunit family amidase